ncbi:hypothetical protein N7520_006137 [Penicillium odoratum]|uniref:uncharacterized protein n=1 Tax=Penicillium odoratum TaxID=1167516 RepID=UPI002549431B|nr:uncharacterized protein N7520_006137 [Penicillium odoratum]KAJ5758981.1 hypothetical protein N7520_006137 [Penicillium odoratum]
MNPALNYRQSRRSACDRCRGFKLRCERDHVNGRSCERCLKAQVLCTTSINHPSSNYLSSKSGHCSYQGDCDPRSMGFERHSMPILHKSTNSKVKKSLSAGNVRKPEYPKYNSWPYPENFSPWVTEDTTPFSVDMGFQAASYPATVFPFDQWNEQQPPWTTGLNPMLPVEDFFIQSDYGLYPQKLVPNALLMEPFNLQDESYNSVVSSLPSEPPNILDPCPSTVMDGIWGASWDRIPAVAENEKQGTISTTDWSTTNNYNVRKRLLILNLELIDDLELLEADVDILQPSAFFGDDISFSAGKLDIPIFRMLSHSTQFLEILQSGIGSSENPSHVIPSIEFSLGELNTFEDVKSSPQNVKQRGASTASSNDSSHRRINPSLLDQPGTLLPPQCDVSTSMGILTVYCHLIRVYRAIFSQIYQLFILVPPVDAAAFLLLPGLQYGQFQMDGNLTVQMQFLIDFSTEMLAKIEQALGMPCSDMDGVTSPVASILGSGPLASVRDHIMTQEQVQCGIPLKETMNCLRELLKDPVD